MIQRNESADDSENREGSLPLYTNPKMRYNMMNRGASIGGLLLTADLDVGTRPCRI